MKATYIYIKNFMGIKELKITPGKVTNITGANGVGKSSIANALRTLLKTKGDPELLHKGTNEAEVVMQLDDGTELRRVYSNNGTKLTINKGDMTVSKPQTWLESMYNLVSNNPLDIMYKKSKERLDIVLRALPLEADKEYLQTFTDKEIDWRQHTLVIIDKIYNEVFDKRANVNRDYQSKVKAVEELRETVELLDVPEDIDKQIEQTELLKKQLHERMATYVQDVKGRQQARIDELKVELQKELGAITDKYNALINEEKERAEQQVLVMKEEHDKNYIAASEKSAELMEQLKQRTAAENTLRLIDQYANEATQLKEQHTYYDNELKDLIAHKKQLLEELPIAGLTLQDGELYYDVDGQDVSYDKLNTATQMKLAVQIATLQESEVKLMCLDGIERLDNESRIELQKIIDESGYQVIVTSVSDEPLEITTGDKIKTKTVLDVEGIF